eukprot:TRINITY_DN10572_c0_g1_i6.p1 TRINITY_DN10572_c0_g1~~TRINITY_DN10572_c0_g1_i6.p1  ORF type:complete len:102 (+),score=3.65 TRINITY_DN10572_c0_g1_i6:54-359(+)
MMRKYNAVQSMSYNESQFFSMLFANAFSTSLKLLDIMLFKNDSNPHKQASAWYYTTPSGQLQSCDLESMELNDLIHAILCNIKGTSTITHDCIIVRRPFTA